MEQRELAGDQATEGMADHDERRFNTSRGKRGAEFSGHRRGGARRAAGLAPAEARTVIGHDASEAGEAVLEVAPVEAGCDQAGFKDDRRRSGASGVQVEARLTTFDHLPQAIIKRKVV